MIKRDLHSKDLIKHTSQMHRDYNNLNEALAEIQKVAEHVNIKIKEAERRHKLAEVAHRITCLDFVSKKLVRF